MPRARRGHARVIAPAGCTDPRRIHAHRAHHPRPPLADRRRLRHRPRRPDLPGHLLAAGPLFADGVAGIEDKYVGGDMARTFTGGILESFAFLLLVALFDLPGAAPSDAPPRPAAGPRGPVSPAAWPTSRSPSPSGSPPAPSAMYGAQHGLDVDTAFALNNLRIFGYFLSLMLLGACTIGSPRRPSPTGCTRGWFGGVRPGQRARPPRLHPAGVDRPPGLGHAGVGRVVRRRRRAACCGTVKCRRNRRFPGAPRRRVGHD